MIVRHSRAGARLLAAVLVAGLSLVGAASAQAVTAAVDGDTLEITGTDADEYVRVSKGNAAGTQWLVESTGSSPTAGSACSVQSIYLYCSNAGVTKISAALAGGIDQFKISGGSGGVTPDLVTATMGDGNDNYQDDRVNGAADVDFGAGNDRGLMGSASIGTHESGAVVFDGGPGDDNLDGGEDDDTLVGGDGDDLIQGHGGADYVDGGADGDILEGNDGDDEVYGSAGDDAIGGGFGSDYIDAGAGQDRVGADHYIGLLNSQFNAFYEETPGGNDRIYIHDGEQDEVRCGGGEDYLQFDSNDYAPGEDEVAKCENAENPDTAGGGDGGGGGGGTGGGTGGTGGGTGGTGGGTGGTGGGGSTPTGGGSTTTTPPGGGSSSPAPTPSPLVVRDNTRTAQKLAKVLRSGLAATLTTNGAGTWRLRLLAGRKLIGTATKTVGGAGTFTTKVKLNKAGRKRLKRARKARLTLRSTFVDAQGRTATTTRKLTLRR